MRFALLSITVLMVFFAAFEWAGSSVNAADEATPPPPPPPPAAAALPDAPATPEIARVEVLAAKTGIPAGMPIDASMTERRSIPARRVTDNFIPAGKENLLEDKVARVNFQPRQILTLDKLANSNDPNFLAGRLLSGIRAITVTADAMVGITEGDRVDVLYTYADTHGREATSQVLIPNVTVLMIRETPGKDIAVALEVTDAQAQQLRLAEKTGAVSLALRSIRDNNKSEVPAATHLDNLSPQPIVETKVEKIRARKKPEPAVRQTANNSVKIVRGVARSGGKISVGGAE